MRTDWQLIRRAAEELRVRLAGAKVRDVGMLGDGRTAIQLWRRGATQLLVFDLFGTPPLITLESVELPIATDPGFVRALGSTLRGMTLLGVESRTGDRLLRMTFGARSRFGVGDTVTLYAELVPRFGNLILVKGETVVAAAKEFSLAENAHRAVAAGAAYVLPPSHASPARGDAVAEDASVLEAFSAARAVRSDAERVDRGAQRKRELNRRLAKFRARWKRERDSLASKRRAVDERETLRAQGDEIFATLHERTESERDAEVERATKLFARYKKLGASLPHLEEREALAVRALADADELAWEIERADDAAIDDVERAIDALLGVPQGRRANPSVKARKRAPLEVRTETGSRILIGRSPTENAELTFRTARPDDRWFHAQKIPGAHVILQRDDRQDPTLDDIERAASLAAFFSKGRSSGTVAVDYTLRKHVRAQKNAAPGRVWYTHATTIFAAPRDIEKA